ncbi:NAD(P)/FAD-dependent oxidoreductase [Acinetobacter baumannii]|nr:NAD(P)/FAD-dependent oxidoreductase [Acinetobacter baumannii]
MNKLVKPSTPTQLVDVLIIGAGPSGLSTCIKLKEQGIKNVVILDMASRIGGTWALNDYPGLFCDVPSEMYSLGFAPNPNWSRTYAPQAEIRQYLEDVAYKFEIVNQIKLNTEVTHAEWNNGLNRWLISTRDGKKYSAKIFVPATGFIGEAKMPSFPGQEKFKGTMFHSGKWNHEHDLTGEKVAVIGSGASAIQFLPAIQPKVGHLYSFQRTPSWVLPKPDFAVPNIVKVTFKKAPILEKIIRESALWSLEPSLPIFMNENIMRKLHALGKLNIFLGVKDPEMRKALTPTHTLGCKRPMFSNNWYTALAKPNVTVLFQGLSHITENGVVGEDGKEIKVDTIIFGTGYAVAEPAIYKIIKGADGRSLSDVWQCQPRAYMGMSIHGFPNMFMMLGPNSQNTVGSVMWTAEQQSVYIAKMVKLIQQQRLDRIEVKADVQKRFNDRIDKRLAKMPVRPDVCKSYYLDDAGRNHIIWPEFGFVIKHKLHHVNLKDYDATTKVIKVVA